MRFEQCTIPNRTGRVCEKCSDSAVTHLCSCRMLRPLKWSANICQALMSLRLSLFRVMRWFGLVTDLVKSYRRLKKHRSGTTTLQQKLRRPRRDWRSFSLILRFILYLDNKSLAFSSLSWGSLASILAESSSKPMNVMQVVAYSVFSFFMGTPRSEHIARKEDNFSLHWLL